MYGLDVDKSPSHTVGLESKSQASRGNYCPYKVAIPHGGLGTGVAGTAQLPNSWSPSHTVGLEPWETYSLLLLPHIAIPRGGLGTYVLNLIENYIDTQESPSHPVGLERQTCPMVRPPKVRSPSHTVGLEPEFKVKYGLNEDLSPSHPVGLEYATVARVLVILNITSLHPTRWAQNKAPTVVCYRDIENASPSHPAGLELS